MPKMALPKMPLCSSSGLKHLPKFSNNVSPLNFLTQKKTLKVLPLKIRDVGNVGCRIVCMSSDGKKMSARLSQMNKVLQDAEERAAGANEPIPRVSLERVMVSFARSGGPGGQNVNKDALSSPTQRDFLQDALKSFNQPAKETAKGKTVGPVNLCQPKEEASISKIMNTKVDMRFNVAAADWLSPRVRERILQMEKNRINNDGELVISSTKTRTQKGNVEDALEKLQAIIDAAAYVPPPPSEEKKQRIRKLAAIEEKKRLKMKKAHSQKKATRRNDKYGWE